MRSGTGRNCERRTTSLSIMRAGGGRSTFGFVDANERVCTSTGRNEIGHENKEKKNTNTNNRPSALGDIPRWRSSTVPHRHPFIAVRVGVQRADSTVNSYNQQRYISEIEPPTPAGRSVGRPPNAWEGYPNEIVSRGGVAVGSTSPYKQRPPPLPNQRLAHPFVDTVPLEQLRMQTGMILMTIAAALLRTSCGGSVSIRMPYLSPAGVTYINNVESADLAYAVPANVGYAAAQVPAVAAVPFVKHVPTVSHVPVTRFEDHPVVLEKQLDVVKPAVQTRKFEVRRPAIQKQFYDIEERVVVRPAGSAVVELEQPTSKIQKGPAVLRPYYPQQFEGIYNFAPSTIAPPFLSSDAPNSNEESVVVENPDFRKGQAQEQATVRLPNPQVRTGSNVAADEPFVAADPSPNVIVSPNFVPEEDRNNREKLLELITARGNVAEVGFGRSGLARTALEEISRVRGRVLSAIPAPDDAQPADERVSTRRVVVTRPIETLQELNVVEPATKIERVSYQQPTFIKTARLEHVPVHSSIPVIGKALAPAVAHAAFPVYRKTIEPVY